MSELMQNVKNQKASQAVMQECISKVSSIQIKKLWQLNKAYREAEHDLQLMKRLGAITDKDANDTLDKMQFQYVEKGLKIGDEGYED